MIDHAERLREILATTSATRYVGDTRSRLAILETADYIEDLILGIRILYFYGRGEQPLSDFLPEPAVDIIEDTPEGWVCPEPGVPE